MHRYIFIISQRGWLLIREVQWPYWTQELLVPAEKFTVRMPMMGLELELAILFVYFYFRLSLVPYVYSPQTHHSSYAQRENCVKLDFMWNWLIELSTKFDRSRTESLLQVTRGSHRCSLRSLVLRTAFQSLGTSDPGYIIGILTVNFSTGTRSSCVQ